jgi:3-deoxy-7-phosphoheptulonate synthase
MVVVMEADAPVRAIEAVVSYLVGAGCDVHRSSGKSTTILGVVGSLSASDAACIAEMEGVAKVVRVSEPYRLASLRFRKEPSIIDGPWGAIGGPRPWIAVEPIGVEGVEGVDGGQDDAAPVSYSVASGGSFDAAVTRAAQGPDDIFALSCLSLHPRPMDRKWPVLFVTREPGASIQDWIAAAEVELVRGGEQVVLLEDGAPEPDGTRRFEVSGLARVRLATHLPVVVDVPRIAQERKYAAPVAYAAIAAGASGVILRAWAGGPARAPRTPATLSWDAAIEVVNRLRAIGEAVRA